jgi:putative ABC transport system substrate-binding protein
MGFTEQALELAEQALGAPHGDGYQGREKLIFAGNRFDLLMELNRPVPDLVKQIETLVTKAEANIQVNISTQQTMRVTLAKALIRSNRGAEGMALLDKLVDDNLDKVIARAKADKVPLVAHNTPGVKRGAFCAVEAPARVLGRQAAKQAYRIMSGVQPGAVPVEFPGATRLVVNRATAAEIGLAVPTGVEPDFVQ